MNVLLWGTSDTGKPRNRKLVEALHTAGVNVTDLRRDVWSGVEDKSQLSRTGSIARLARTILAYPPLLAAFLRAPRPDIVLLGYPAQIDVLVLWPFAKMRGVPVIADLFISLYDTTVMDRRMVKPRSFQARMIRGLEWLACRAADRLLIDTQTHASYIEELHGLPRDSIGHVPVGAEDDKFPRLAQSSGHARPRLLFYGQLIPLHGIETVLEAALSKEGEAYDWFIIGSGQDTPKVEASVQGKTLSHITWKRWVAYEDLSNLIAEADACLGIFGTSRKAASVIPNKVYQCLASGRHVITRQSPAIEELRKGLARGLTLVEPGSAQALLDGIAQADRNGFPPPDMETTDRFSTQSIADRLLQEFAKVIR